MINLTLPQLLLWIIAIGLVIIPLISILVNTIVTGYFVAREKHIYRIFSNFSKAFEAMLSGLSNEIEKMVKNGKDKTDGGDSNS